MKSRIFSTFSVVLLVLGRPEHSSPLTDTQLALKHEWHLQTTVQLKECSSKASRRISRGLVADLPSFTQNFMQTLLEFAIHHRQHKAQSRKSTLIRTVRCHVADWCNRLAEVWAWPPLSSSFTEAVTAITVWEISDTTYETLGWRNLLLCYYFVLLFILINASGYCKLYRVFMPLLCTCLVYAFVG
jgi:hypothetical protein